MESAICARCDGSVPLDVTHAKVTIEAVRMEDRNTEVGYILCADCELKVLDEWSDPA